MLPTATKALTAAANVAASQRTPSGERNLTLGLAPKTIFNDSITHQRPYSAMSVPLADIKALGKRVGGTVNTVVTAMCSIALHRFLKDRNLLPKEPLIAMVPVSLRSEGDSSMNNQVSMVPGLPTQLYMAGAKIVRYYPVSIPYHGNAFNITVHSYAGMLEFGLTACRRILSQDESYEIVEHLKAALPVCTQQRDVQPAGVSRLDRVAQRGSWLGHRPSLSHHGACRPRRRGV